MAKKKPQHQKKPRKRHDIDLENRAAVAVTVMWMLTTIATLMAQLVWAGSFTLVNLLDKAGNLAVLPGLMLFTGVVSGIVCLILAPVAWRIREVPPPRSVTLVAIIIGTLPLITAATLAIVTPSAA